VTAKPSFYGGHLAYRIERPYPRWSSRTIGGLGKAGLVATAGEWEDRGRR
jgi:hypothetical protein